MGTPGLRSRIERVEEVKGQSRLDARWTGSAFRLFLGLDRTSFRGDPSGDTEPEERRRLAWISCNVSDRLISVRIGRAVLVSWDLAMTGLVSQDFPPCSRSRKGMRITRRSFKQRWISPNSMETFMMSYTLHADK